LLRIFLVPESTTDFGFELEGGLTLRTGHVDLPFVDSGLVQTALLAQLLRARLGRFSQFFFVLVSWQDWLSEDAGLFAGLKGLGGLGQGFGRELLEQGFL